MDRLVPHSDWVRLLVVGIVVVGLAVLVGSLGFGVAPWVILVGAFCTLMMGSMIGTVFAMGRNALHRH
jgi:hypothetical protein